MDDQMTIAPQFPDFIAQAMISPKDIREDIPPQSYIDGFMFPFATCTMLSTAGGSGKTTSGTGAAVTAAANGRFDFFGERQHERPMRSILVLGEETADMISRKLAFEIVDGIKLYRDASGNGNIAIISWLEYGMRSTEAPEKIFEEKGSLTEQGRKLFAALKTFKPDFVFFDTLSSLSDGDYLSDRVAYTTIRELNSLAAATGAAVVMTAHLVKGGAAKIDSTSSADDMIALSRGSAAMINAARHAIVLVPANSGDFPGINIDDGDQIWRAGVKSNIGFPLANCTFPVVRSSKRRTFLAMYGGNQTFAEKDKEHATNMIRLLERYMFHAIRLAAESLQPFAECGKMSPEGLCKDLLMPIMPNGASPFLVARAVDNLIRKQEVCPARSTASGGMILDVEGGPFAAPDHHLDQAGKPPKFKPGAADIQRLADRIHAAVNNEMNAPKNADPL
jgi:hypothetical protein